MNAQDKWTPDPAGVYFSDYFGIAPDVIEAYGALDISVVSDLPLFIDPFLAFNSSTEVHQALHEQIIEYLRYLREKASVDGLTEATVKNLYSFKEVKQNWLGFTVDSNDGKGLGPKFAKALHAALGDILSNFGEETVTSSSHLEKVALIQEGVGRDNISDFTTNLVKHYLLTFTEQFAQAHLNASQVKKVQVPRAVFNYNTATWATRPYTLPWIEARTGTDGAKLAADYVILSPLDLLTKDDTWINQGDMISRFDTLPAALPDDQTRAQVNSYFSKKLGQEPTPKEVRAARMATIRAFPELVDYYIAIKEATRDEAASESIKKAKDIQRVMRDQVQGAARDLAAKTDFYAKPWSSLDEARDAVATFKTYVEDQDGYTLINRGGGTPFSKEAEVQTFFGLLLQRSRFDFNREPNNGRGPVDFKLSEGAFDKTLIEFKLAKSSSLKRNLLKQVEIYQKANKTDNAVKVVIVYTAADQTRADRIFKEVDVETGNSPGTTAQRVVVVDARADNKPSASKA